MAALYAIHLPSGEMTGFTFVPGPVVSGCASPPARGAVQMSSPYVNTTWVVLIDGECSRGGAAIAAAAIDVNARMQRMTDARRVAMTTFFLR
jgi:hypothetical protein